MSEDSRDLKERIEKEMVVDETAPDPDPAVPADPDPKRVAVRARSAFSSSTGAPDGDELVIAGFESGRDAEQWARAAAEADLIARGWGVER